MTDFALKATLKGGAEYDAPWITIDANNPVELKAKAEALAASGAIQAVVEVAALFKGANHAAPLLPAVGQGLPPQAAPQGVEFDGNANPPPSVWQTQAQPAQQVAVQQRPGAVEGQAAPQQQGGPSNGQPHPEGKACSCGSVLQWKAFTSKAGKDLKMWTCPNQHSQDDGHFSEFVW